MHFRRYQKQLLWMTNMRTYAAECIPTKQRAKTRVPWEILEARKKACRHKNCIPMQ